MIDYNPPLQPHSCLYVPPNLSWNPKHRICIEIFEKDVFCLSKTHVDFYGFHVGKGKYTIHESYGGKGGFSGSTLVFDSFPKVIAAFVACIFLWYSGAVNGTAAPTIVECVIEGTLSMISPLMMKRSAVAL